VSWSKKAAGCLCDLRIKRWKTAMRSGTMVGGPSQSSPSPNLEPSAGQRQVSREIMPRLATTQRRGGCGSAARGDTPQHRRYTVHHGHAFGVQRKRHPHKWTSHLSRDVGLLGFHLGSTMGKRRRKHKLSWQDWPRGVGVLLLCKSGTIGQNSTE
jgi:hypothetical protein